MLKGIPFFSSIFSCLHKNNHALWLSFEKPDHLEGSSEHRPEKHQGGPIVCETNKMGRGDADQMWAEQTVDSLMGDNQSSVVLDLLVPRSSSAAPPPPCLTPHRITCSDTTANVVKIILINTSYRVLPSLKAIASTNYFLILKQSQSINQSICKDEQFKTWFVLSIHGERQTGVTLSHFQCPCVLFVQRH